MERVRSTKSDKLAARDRTLRWRKGQDDFRRCPAAICPIVLFALFVTLVHNSSLGQAIDSANRFQRDVVPLLDQYCLECHLEGDGEGGIVLEGFADQSDALAEGHLWLKVLDVLESGLMPPDDMPRPDGEEVQQIISWIENEYFPTLCGESASTPAVVMRRLNRQEYDNTIRDLTGLDLKLARDFPPDDSGFGYDNVGSALNVSPIHIEKYLRAAEQVMDAAIVVPDATPFSPAELIGLRTYPLTSDEAVEFEHHLSPGRYLVDFSLVRAGIDEDHPPPYLSIGFGTDKRRVWAIRVQDETVVYRLWLNVSPGDALVRVALAEQPAGSSANEDAEVGANVSGDQRYGSDRGLHVDSMVVRGPYVAAAEELPEPHREILFCTPGADGTTRRDCAHKVIARFAQLAFRRDVADREVERLLGIFDLADERGESFERATQVALVAALVSPQFLYLVEPEESKADRPLTETELATRLSYFLWSTMPDAALRESARQGTVRSELKVHVARMLADPKADAFVENFVGQWLRIRDLETMSRDAELFANFDERLKEVMQQETEHFFAYILRNNRSVLELLDSDYTFLNERLAQHYGIEGVEGPEFRRVALRGGDRGGVLTQASVLTLTSNPNRTSPVKRGQFVLQQLLGTPPPPPPPGVSELDESPAASEAASLRDRLERHRADPQCASCHKQMDAMGFAFENYDAVGRRRETDGGFPIDTAGQLTEGVQFRDAAELKQVLRTHASKKFTRCLIENMLTYALGRSVEPQDYCVIEHIREDLEKHEFRIQRIIQGIVQSDAFQRRGVSE